jgi:hypothetical protein
MKALVSLMVCFVGALEPAGFAVLFVAVVFLAAEDVDLVVEMGLPVLVFGAGFFAAGVAAVEDGAADGSWRIRPRAAGSIASSVPTTPTQMLGPTFSRTFGRILVQTFKLASLRHDVIRVLFSL